MNIHQMVRTTYGLLGLVALVALGIGGYFAYQAFSGFWKKSAEVTQDTGNFLSGKPTQYGAELGGSCKVGADCKGYTSALAEKGGIACCEGSCAQTVKDFMNVWYCPRECKGWLGAPGGSCGPKKPDGQACVAHEQCANWHGPGREGSGCDQGRCVPMKKDVIGIWWVPSECVGDILRGKGSC
jgi:hypothetical protein